MDILDKLDVRYVLETNKSKEDIIVCLKLLRENETKLRGLASFFQSPFYGSMSIYNNKTVELELLTSRPSSAPIGTITLNLETTPTGTTISAELKPDRFQFNFVIPCLLFSLFMFAIFGKQILQKSDIDFLVILIVLSAVVLVITLFSIFYTRSSLKDSLFKVFIDIGVGSQFTPI